MCHQQARAGQVLYVQLFDDWNAWVYAQQVTHCLSTAICCITVGTFSKV